MFVSQLFDLFMCDLYFLLNQLYRVINCDSKWSTLSIILHNWLCASFWSIIDYLLYNLLSSPISLLFFWTSSHVIFICFSHDTLPLHLQPTLATTLLNTSLPKHLHEHQLLSNITPPTSATLHTHHEFNSHEQSQSSTLSKKNESIKL